MIDPAGLVHVRLSADKRTALVSFPEPAAEGEPMALDLAHLTALIQELGRARAAMTVGSPVPPIEGARAELTFETRWHTQYDPRADRTVFAFQHAAYGPLGTLLDGASVALLRDLLTQQLRTRPGRGGPGERMREEEDRGR